VSTKLAAITFSKASPTDRDQDYAADHHRAIKMW
jgi:hypothetical protein